MRSARTSGAIFRGSLRTVLRHLSGVDGARCSGQTDEGEGASGKGTVGSVCAREQSRRRLATASRIRFAGMRARIACIPIFWPIHSSQRLARRSEAGEHTAVLSFKALVTLMSIHLDRWLPQVAVVCIVHGCIVLSTVTSRFSPPRSFCMRWFESTSRTALSSFSRTCCAASCRRFSHQLIAFAAPSPAISHSCSLDALRCEVHLQPTPWSAPSLPVAETRSAEEKADDTRQTSEATKRMRRTRSRLCARHGGAD